MTVEHLTKLMSSRTPLFQITEVGGAEIPAGSIVQCDGRMDLMGADPVLCLYWPPGSGEKVGQTLDGLAPLNESACHMVELLRQLARDGVPIVPIPIDAPPAADVEGAAI
jgi:hypothetical protein